MPVPGYFRDRREKRRNHLRSLLGGKCTRCGSTKDLHFDHKNPKKKKRRIADMIDSPEAILMDEITKCVLLCAPCHRDKTREKGEHGQPKSKHGTIWMYKKYRCRCPKCRKAMSEYNRNKRIQMLQEVVASFDVATTFEKLATVANLEGLLGDLISSMMTFGRLTAKTPKNVYVGADDKGMLVISIEEELLTPTQFKKANRWAEAIKEEEALIESEKAYLKTIVDNELLNSLCDNARDVGYYGAKRGNFAKGMEQEASTSVDSIFAEMLKQTASDLPHEGPEEEAPMTEPDPQLTEWHEQEAEPINVEKWLKRQV